MGSADFHQPDIFSTCLYYLFDDSPGKLGIPVFMQVFDGHVYSVLKNLIFGQYLRLLAIPLNHTTGILEYWSDGMMGDDMLSAL